MNRVAFVQFVLAILVTQMDAFRRLLDTTDLGMKEFRWALIPPIALLALWELGKYVARRVWAQPDQVPAPSATEAAGRPATVALPRGSGE